MEAVVVWDSVGKLDMPDSNLQSLCQIDHRQNPEVHVGGHLACGCIPVRDPSFWRQSPCQRGNQGLWRSGSLSVWKERPTPVAVVTSIKKWSSFAKEEDERDNVSQACCRHFVKSCRRRVKVVRGQPVEDFGDGGRGAGEDSGSLLCSSWEDP